MSINNKKKNRKLKKRMVNLFIILCFAVAIFLIYQSFATRLEEKKGEEIYSEIAELYSPVNIEPMPIDTEIPKVTENPVVSVVPVTQTPSTETPAPEGSQKPNPVDTIPQRPLIDKSNILNYFLPLLEVNEDICGFIRLPESTINYPVVQGIDNEFYLKRNIYGDETIGASIFMDYRNNVDTLDDNTIIYGHNLNTTMFNDLDFFVDEKTRKEFYEKNGVFRFDTVYKYMSWEVYSAYVVDKDDFNYLITNFPDKESHREFLDETLERSAVDWGIAVTTSDRILTLSTCNHWFNDSRTVIHARLITP